MTREEMREKVKSCMSEVFYNSTKGGPFPWDSMADAAIALVLEEAARVAGDFPAYRHGNLAAHPFAAAQQASDEIAAAIRALKNPA